MPQSPLVKTLNSTAHNITLNARACALQEPPNALNTAGRRQKDNMHFHLRMLIVTCHQAYFTGRSLFFIRSSHYRDFPGSFEL